MSSSAENSTQGSNEAATPVAIATLAVEILNLRPKMDWPIITGIHEPIHDQVFLEALFRAKWLIKQAAGRGAGIVHAYQMFEEGAAPLSPEAVTERLNDVDWKIGTGNTLDKIAKRLLGKAKTEIEKKIERFEATASAKPRRQSYVEEFALKIYHILETGIDNPDSVDFIKSPDKVQQCKDLLLMELDKNPQYFPAESSDLINAELAASCSFLKYVAEGFPDSGRMFRPYELFLFAAQQGLEANSLIRNRAKLNRDADPQPPRNTHISILHCHRGFEPEQGEALE